MFLSANFVKMCSLDGCIFFAEKNSFIVLLIIKLLIILKSITLLPQNFTYAEA